MIIKKRFDYGQIGRTTKSDGSRAYDTPSGKLPSVTTVLSKTKDMTFLKEWKKRVGEEKAQKIVKRSTNLGTKMHKNLENYLLEGKQPEGDIFSIAMTKKIIKNGFDKLDEVWGVEVALFAESLYAGTTDACGVYDGKEAIIDFKNSRSLRKEEWVSDYKLQVVAYQMAHNEMFGTDIKTGVIMLATQDGHYQQWVVEGEENEKCKQDWMKRLEEYYEKYH